MPAGSPAKLSLSLAGSVSDASTKAFGKAYHRTSSLGHANPSSAGFVADRLSPVPGISPFQVDQSLSPSREYGEAVLGTATVVPGTGGRVNTPVPNQLCAHSPHSLFLAYRLGPILLGLSRERSQLLAELHQQP